MAFSQKYPERRKLLWSTRNTTFGEVDGASQLALGMIAGVSDLIYFYDGVFTGIELKVRGSSHATKHVQKQLDWGEKITAQGGRYFIVTTLDEFWIVIDGGDVEYNIEKIKTLLSTTKTTIKF